MDNQEIIIKITDTSTDRIVSIIMARKVGLTQVVDDIILLCDLYNEMDDPEIRQMQEDELDRLERCN